jgi:hypothetical protein
MDANEYERGCRVGGALREEQARSKRRTGEREGGEVKGFGFQ